MTSTHAALGLRCCALIAWAALPHSEDVPGRVPESANPEVPFCVRAIDDFAAVCHDFVY